MAAVLKYVVLENQAHQRLAPLDLPLITKINDHINAQYKADHCIKMKSTLKLIDIAEKNNIYCLDGRIKRDLFKLKPTYCITNADINFSARYVRPCDIVNFRHIGYINSLEYYFKTMYTELYKYQNGILVEKEKRKNDCTLC
jgi:hypothetical protein